MQMQINSLGDLDDLEGGSVGAEFQKKLKEVVVDLEERSGMDKPRSIMVQLDMTPVPEVVRGQVQLAEVRTRVRLKCSIPPVKTREISTMAEGGEMLIYNLTSPDNVHQHTLDEEAERDEERPPVKMASSS